VPRLGDLQGQDRVIAILRAAIGGGRVHHAYLFTGPPGAGKRDAALALASALNCLEAPGEGCDRCAACDRIAQGLHPDVVTMAREGAAQIVPIETVRDVITRTALPPHEARVRVFIVDEANALQGAAANAMLKTLEEPPRNTMFILSTMAPDQLLPTIRSRCQRVSFAPRPAGGDSATVERLGRLADALVEAPGISQSQGPGAARDLGAAIALAQRLAEDKADTPLVLDLALHRFHTRARQAAAAGDDAAARTWAERGRCLLETMTSLSLHNAHPQLTLEALIGRLPALPGAAS
jgi:DNA polymerase III subunit delta'